MTSKELQRILSSARNERRGGAPHEDWVSRNRDILLMQVRNTTVRKTNVKLLDAARSFVSVFLPSEQLLATARAFAVALLVVGTVFGGGLVSVVAYRDASPGDVSYKLKLAVEKAQVALAPNDAYRVRLHSEFADRRLDEAAKLAEGPETGRRLAVGVLESFNKELVSLRDGLLGLKTLDPEGVAVAAKLLDRKMVVYQQVLKGVVRNLPVDVRPQALAVVDRVEGLSLQAMAVLVEQYQAGDVNASKNSVANRIEDRILQAEAKLTVSAEAAEPVGSKSAAKTTQAKAAIAQARELLKNEDYQAAFSKMVEVVELTKGVEDETAAEAETVAPADASNVAPDSTTEIQKTETEQNKDGLNADPAKAADGTAPSADSAGSGNR